ncbi:general odorant-binding protein 70 [Ctenocephalides felis]|uniref:general odorant-binding protein 70 n=1 Tax=Ctenocephalides felis TaxID=7515 RepID=UPI000E6E3488|nr:general odorant-binding protein 70 [Ctenocephalides felis]
MSFTHYNIIIDGFKQPTRCLTQPTAPKAIENVINTCQEEVKQTILLEALNIITEQSQKEQKLQRQKREAAVSLLSSPRYPNAPPSVTNTDDKRIAGCLLHCVYKKIGALDHNGWPTLDGLVSLYSGGVKEQGYFMATLRASALCLQRAQKKRLEDNFNDGGQQCDTAYDVFDCISDRLGEYCADQ